MKIVFASSNKGKIKEVQSLLSPDYEIVGLEDIGIIEEIPETGETIRENSFLKADYVRRHFQKNNLSYSVFADDSGLEVQYLNGAPGVKSARFAGEQRSDVANNQKLLNELSSVTNRKARFVTVITLITDGEKQLFEGEIPGTIAHEPRGQNGFGYDPLFVPQGYRSTFAELTPEIKNAISHRAIAVKKLVDFLKKSDIKKEKPI